MADLEQLKGKYQSVLTLMIKSDCRIFTCRTINYF